MEVNQAKSSRNGFFHWTLFSWEIAAAIVLYSHLTCSQCVDSVVMVAQNLLHFIAFCSFRFGCIHRFCSCRFAIGHQMEMIFASRPFFALTPLNSEHDIFNIWADIRRYISFHRNFCYDEEKWRKCAQIFEVENHFKVKKKKNNIQIQIKKSEICLLLLHLNTYFCSIWTLTCYAQNYLYFRFLVGIFTFRFVVFPFTDFYRRCLPTACEHTKIVFVQTWLIEDEAEEEEEEKKICTSVNMLYQSEQKMLSDWIQLHTAHASYIQVNSSIQWTSVGYNVHLKYEWQHKILSVEHSRLSAIPFFSLCFHYSTSLSIVFKGKIRRNNSSS